MNGLKAIIYFCAILFMSIVTLIFFIKDKKSSKNEGNGRIPEIVLLSLASFGGAPGAMIGMYVLRHKTNPITKFHFTITVWLALIVQILVGVLMIMRAFL